MTASPDLGDYDVILVSSSAGKDSQAMLDYVVELARAAGVLERVHVVHCDLGRVEWQGTRELAQEQAGHYGLPFHVVRRDKGDLLDQVEARGMWPDSANRYCTSDQKRDQVAKLVTRLAKQFQVVDRPVRILSCMGLRAEESPARAKRPAWAINQRWTNSRRVVHDWLPIHSWTLAQVWARIRKAGTRHHPAYDLGMPRLSCVFCIFAPRSALLLAGQHNPELLAEYVRIEQQIGHTFRKNQPITEISRALLAGEQPGELQDWACSY